MIALDVRALLRPDRLGQRDGGHAHQSQVGGSIATELLLPTAVTLRAETVAVLTTQRQAFEVQERLTDLLRPQGVYAPRPEPAPGAVLGIVPEPALPAGSASFALKILGQPEPEPEVQLSVVQVQVVGARGLAKMDGIFTVHGRSADPFVTINQGDQSQQTRVQKGTLQPTWNETFIFDRSESDEPLVAQLWDWDRITTNDPMGQVVLPGTVGLPMDVPEWFKLQPSEGCEKPQGEILLACNVVSKTDLAISQLIADKSDADEGKGVLNVRVFAVECGHRALPAASVQRRWAENGCSGCDVTLTLSAAAGDRVALQRTVTGSVVVPGLVSTLVNVDKTLLQFGGNSGEELQFAVDVGAFNRSSERRVVALGFPDIGGGIEIDLKVCTQAIFTRT